MINNLELYIVMIMFFIGLFGCMVNKKNFIKFIVSVEVIVLSGILLVATSYFNFESKNPEILSMSILPIAAIEVAICIAIVCNRKEE